MNRIVNLGDLYEMWEDGKSKKYGGTLMVLTLKETENRFRQGTSGRNGRMAGSFRQGTSRCQSSTAMFKIGVSLWIQVEATWIWIQVEGTWICVASRRKSSIYKINHFFPKPDFAKELLLAV
jgi:hypothetical protein